MKGKEARHAYDDGPQNGIADVEVVVGEAASLVRQNAMVGILRRIFGHADPEGTSLLHALEDEVDAVGILLLHAAQRGQDVVLFAGSFFGPLHRDLVFAGVRLNPVPVIVGALAEDFFAHHRDAEDLPEEINHLLGPGQTAQVPMNDDAGEGVINQGQEIGEQLDEPFHVHALYSMESKSCGPQNHQTPVAWTGGGRQGLPPCRRDWLHPRQGRRPRRADCHHRPTHPLLTDTGDAWMLDVTDQLAVRLAGDRDPEPICLEETATSFAIEWKGRYRIEEPAFIYTDRHTGRVTTILGYPTHKIAHAG